MRHEFINKIIAGTIISTTLCTLVPIRASADWVSDYQNNRYYLKDGQKMTGWKKIDGQLYYFDENGKMKTGWIIAENKVYFLKSNGILELGWFKYDKDWYYSDSTGAIQTGTLNIAGKVYIFDNNGKLKTNNMVINGEFYTIGSDGAVAGAKVPTPDKEYDDAGNCLEVLKNIESNGSISPTHSSFDDVIEDQSVSNDDPNEGRTFKVIFKDSDGSNLKIKSIKNGKLVDLFSTTKDGYVFKSWNTKSDGSGKSYGSDDNIKIKEDINLYAQWSIDTTVYVDTITIKGNSYVTADKTTQMTAEVSPSNAKSTSIIWSVSDGTGKATIDSNGVLTGILVGTVKVTATAQDKSKVSVTKEVTVSLADVIIPVSKISVDSKTKVLAIADNGGTLQMSASVYPATANNQEVTWSINNVGGSASIDANTGLVTAISDGEVTVKATAKDGSGIVGNTNIKISGQTTKIPVASVVISGNDGVSTINTDIALGGTNGKLQMSAEVLPAAASNKAITWSIVSGNEYAKVSSTGLITAIANGTAVVQATVNETGMISNQMPITITNQSVKLTGITVSGITTMSGDTTFSIETLPTNATVKEVKWIVENQTGSAVLANDTGLSAVLKPQSNGKVVLKAIATANDGTIVYDTQDVDITGQSTIINITSIDDVYGENKATSVTKDDGTLQMYATITPSYATDASSAVRWAIIGSGATIDQNTGVLKAISNGKVTVRAISKTNSAIYKEGYIYIYGQIVQVSGITINSPTDEVTVGTTLQMSAVVAPTNATYQNVTWYVESGTGTADIDKTSGLLTGRSVGDVTVVAVADNGTGISSTKKIAVNP